MAKIKPMTAAELAALPAGELGKVATKKRVAAALRRGEKARKVQREAAEAPPEREPIRPRRDFRGGHGIAEAPEGIGPFQRLGRVSRKGDRDDR